jgi:hypothetical protein
MNDEKEYEFSNIERDELPALQGYVGFYLRERKKAQKVIRENTRMRRFTA